MPMFKQEQINQLLDMTLKAKKPLILMGSQAMLPPIKTENLRKTIEVQLFFRDIEY
jgi:thiamine pyrophosphate-dependent acetolactate synthase large subunit-like protein